MIINFSVLPKSNQLGQFENLRLAVPNDFSKEEVAETIIFLKDYINQKYERTIQPIHPKTPISKNNTKKITLRHFYNFLSIVKIRDGIRDTEFDFDLSGLKGQILLFFQDDFDELYYIQWLQDSFLKIPDEYLLQLLENDLPWSGTYIESSNLVPCQSDSSLDSLDLVLINKYIKFISQSAREFWENQVLPLVKSHQNAFLAWEELFFDLTYPVSFSYQSTNPDAPEKHINCLLTLAGFDTVFGLWVSLSNEKEEIIIPLSQITQFDDSALDQKLKFYQDWVRIYCPES